MKLYTEEQVRHAWNVAYIDALSIDNEDYKPKFYDEFINELTSIELPSDEEIKEASPIVNVNAHDYYFGHLDGFIDGAKWQQERMYSEEEVQVKLYECLGHFAQKHNIIINSSEIDQWFKQFKKK